MNAGSSHIVEESDGHIEQDGIQIIRLECRC